MVKAFSGSLPHEIGTMNPPGKDCPRDCRIRNLASIVSLSAADLPDVLALEKECFSKPWTMGQMQSSLGRKSFSLLGAKGASGLLGYVSLQIIAPELEILNIAVHPAFRGQGVGRGLAFTALQLGFKQGATTCYLEVAADNSPALRLYKGLGFAATGTRKGYYQEAGRNVDAVIMFKTLSPNLIPPIQVEETP